MEIITTLLESIDPNMTYGIIGAAVASLGRKKRKKKAVAKAKTKYNTKLRNQEKYRKARKAYKKRGASNVTRSTKAKGGR